MAARKNRKRGAIVLDDLSKPSQWRLQHGGFNPPSYDADPDTGMVVTHHRAVDTLGMMLSNRTITQEMYDAGTMFRMLFRSARLGASGASSLARMPGKTTRGMSSDHMQAGIKIAEAIDALGGYDSAAGCWCGTMRTTALSTRGGGSKLCGDTRSTVSMA